MSNVLDQLAAFQAAKCKSEKFRHDLISVVAVLLANTQTEVGRREVKNI